MRPAPDISSRGSRRFLDNEIAANDCVIAVMFGIFATFGYHSTMTNPKTTSRTDTSLQTQLLTLAETPNGFSASEVTGCSPELVRRTANGLVKAERMVRAKLGARSVRYFKSEALADAYRAGQPTAARTSVVLGPRSKAGWSADEPGIITSRTKITIAPPLPRRVLRTNTYMQF
jgi:hypothetical protein